MSLSLDYIAMVKEEFTIAAAVAMQLLNEQLISLEQTGVPWHETDIDARRALLFRDALDAAGISLVRTH